MFALFVTSLPKKRGLGRPKVQENQTKHFQLVSNLLLLLLLPTSAKHVRSLSLFVSKSLNIQIQVTATLQVMPQMLRQRRARADSSIGMRAALTQTARTLGKELHICRLKGTGVLCYVQSALHSFACSLCVHLSGYENRVSVQEASTRKRLFVV